MYPSSRSWTSVADCFWRFTNHHGTEQLLVSLAMGKIGSCPFPPDEVAQLKESVFFFRQLVSVIRLREDMAIAQTSLLITGS